MSDILEILIQGSLDKSKRGVDSIRRDLKDIQAQLKEEKLKIEVELDDKELKTFKNQIKELGDTLKQTMESANLAKFEQEMQKSAKRATELDQAMKGIQEQTNLLSKTTKMDFLSGTQTHTEEMQKDLLTVQKTVESISASGEKLVHTEERKANYAKIQRELYADLNKEMNTLHKLQQQRLQAGEGTKAQIDSEIKSQRISVQNILDTIEAENLRSQALDQSIEKTQQMKAIQDSIRAEQGQEAQSKQAYSELMKLEREKFRLSKLAEQSEGEVNLIYEKRLQDIQSISRELRSQIESGGLQNKERELVLQEQIKKNETDMLALETKAEQQESLRIARLNERLILLRDIVGVSKEEEMNIMGNQQNIEKMVLNMEEFSNASLRGESRVLAYSNSIDAAGNAQARMTVQTTHANGIVKEHRVVVDESTQAVYRLSERTKEASNRSLEFSERMKEAVKRSVQWAISTKLVGEAFKFLMDSARHVVELDSQLTQIAMVTGQTREQVEYLADAYVKLGQEMGKTSTEISAVNTELVRQGLTTDEAIARMETILQLSSVTGMDAQKTLSIVTSGVNALGEEADHLADVLVRAGNVSASSAEQVGDALTRVASSAKSTNTSLEEVTAMVSTLIEVTQESPSSLGNSLKTLMARFNKVSEDTGEMNQTLNETQAAFEKVGVSFVDSAGQIRPFYDLLEDLSEEWVDLDRNTQNYIATAAAGANQRNRFLAIMENFNRVQEIHNDLLISEGTLMDGYGMYLDTTEAKMNSFASTMDEAKQQIMDTDTIDLLIDFANSIAKVLMLIDKWTPGLLEMGLTFILLNRKIEGFSKTLTDMFAVSVMGVQKEIRVLGVEFKATDQTVMGFIKGLGNLVKELFSVDTAAKTTKVGMDGLTVATTSSTGAMLGLKVVAKGLLGILASFALSALIAGISKVVAKIVSAKDATKEMVDEASAAIREHNRGIETLRSLGDEFDELQDKIKKYGDATHLTQEEQARYYEITAKIRDISPEVAVAYENKEGAVLSYGTSIEELIEKEKQLLELEQNRVLSSRGEAEKDFRKDFRSAEKNFNREQDALMAKRRSIREAEKRIQRAEMGGNEDEIRREVEALKILRRQLREIEVTQSEYNAQLEEAKDKYKHIIEAQMLDIELMEGVSDSVKNIVREQAMGLLNSVDGAQDAEVFILEITDRLKELQAQAEDMSPEEVAVALKGLTSDLEDMGISAGEAARLVHQLGVMLGLFADSTDLAGMSFELDTDGLKEFTAEMDNLSGAYRKLAQGQSLSTTELMDLAMEYEEISELLAKDGELTVENMEVIQDLIKDTSRTRMDALKQQQEQHSADKKMAEETVEAHQKTVDMYEAMGLEGTKLHREAVEELKNHENQLVRIRREYDRTARQAKALENIQISGTAGLQQEDYSASFAASSTQLQNYRNMLETLNEEGGRTNAIMVDIANNYPELLGYMQNDEMLRQRLIELIGLEGQARDDHYRHMLASTDVFAAAFYDKNRHIVNEVAKLYDLDLRNFLGSAQAKARAMGELNQYMANSMNMHVKAGSAPVEMVNAKKAQRNALERRISQVAQSDDRSGVSTLGRQIREITAEIEYLEAMDNAMANLPSAPDVPAAPSLGGGRGGSKGAGGSKGTSSVGSSRTAQKIEQVELLTDRYLKYEKALREVNREMEVSESLMDLSSGNDRIRLMEKVNSLLREEQRLVALRAAEQRKERDEVARGLRARSINLDDGTFGLDDFARYTKMVERNINQVVAKINAASSDSLRDSLTEQKDTMEKNYNKVKEDFDTYVELRESIPDLSAQWWALEYEALTRSLEALDIRYELYDERVEHISDKIGYMLGIRDDNLRDLEKEKELMSEIGSIHIDALNDIAVQSERSSKRVAELEAGIERMGDTRNKRYEDLQRDLVVARAEQDRYFEHYQQQLNNLADHMSSVIDNYRSEVERVRDETFDAMDELMVKFEGFDGIGFGQSIDQILFDLDSIDDIIETGFEANLDTTNARDNIEEWRKSILGTVKDLEVLQGKIDGVANSHVDGVDEAEEKTRKLAEMLEEQIDKDNELKILQKELQDEVAEMELANQRAERSLQKQIDLKNKELDQLKEQLAYEEKLRGLRDKQLELMRAQDERSQTYITGSGEEVYTYDHNRVYAIQQELAEMNRKDKEEEMLDAMSEEIAQMQEDLAKTREINAQELSVMRLGLEGLNELIGVSGANMETTRESIEQATEEIVDAFTESTRVEFEDFTSFYEDYWEGKLAREIGDILDSSREINRDKLGGDRNEQFAAGGKIEGGRPNKVVDDRLSSSGGQGLIAGAAGRAYYTPKDGESLSDIAKKFGATSSDIIKMNESLRNGRATLEEMKQIIVPIMSDEPEIEAANLLIDFMNRNVEDFIVLGEGVIPKGGVGLDLEDKDVQRLINIVLNDPNFNEIHDSEDFMGDMLQLARDGMANYS